MKAVTAAEAADPVAVVAANNKTKIKPGYQAFIFLYNFCSCGQIMV